MRDWRDEIADIPVGIELPFDRLRPVERMCKIGRLDATTLARLDEQVRGAGLDTDPDLIWRAALAVLLYRYANQSPVLIGYPGTSRHPDHVGLWRLDLDDASSFAALLRSAKAADAAFADARDLPVAAIRAAQSRHHSAHHAPVFHAGFAWNFVGPDSDLEQWSQYADVTLRRGAASNPELFEVLYNTDLFSVDTAVRMVGHLHQLLRCAMKSPDIPICELPLLPADERHRLLVEWNRTAGDVPADRFLPDMIAQWASRRPDHAALVYQGEVTTYSALERRANHLARRIISALGGGSSPVGVCLERSADCVVAHLAVLKTGRPVVLMDPAHPAAWLRGLAGNAAACAIITRTSFDDTFLPLPIPIIHVETGDRAIAAYPVGAPACELAPDSPDALVGTSGSTGDPKVVVSRHRAVNNMAYYAGAVLGATAETRATWIASPGYGYCRVECWAYLANGGTVFIVDAETAASPERIRTWLLDNAITHTSMMSSMAERLWLLPWPQSAPLQVMQVTGEPLRDWPPLDLPYEVFNNYGSTEATTVASVPLVASARRLSEPERQRQRPPAGRPIPNMRTYVVDGRGHPVPIGVAGELIVAGMGLAAGYSDAALTRARFVANVIAEEPDEIVFLSRDAARMRSDGTLEVLGRLDDEVKINGCRVDLGQVRLQLSRLEGVKDVAVVDRESPERGRTLVAYIVASPGADLSPLGLRGAARASLPEYMVPAAFILVPHLPRLANGKLDRRALAAFETQRAARPSEVAIRPRGLIEETLAANWSRLLRVDQLGVDDNFFDLGGHSLLAVEIVASVQQSLGVRVSLPEFKANPTVSKLARLVERKLLEGRLAEPAADTRHHGAIEPDPDGRYEPFPLTDMQQALWVGRNSAIEFGGVGCHGYFEWEADGLDVAVLETAWRCLIARHDMLRAIILPDGRQRVLPQVPLYRIETIDLRDLAPAAVDHRIGALRAEMSHEVFPADRWPMFRIVAVQCDARKTVILFSIDLLILDAWSYFQIIVSELDRLIARPEAPLPALQITFRDYLLATQKDMAASPEYRRAEAYWRDRLRDMPAAPLLPRLNGAADRRRPVFRSRRHRIEPARWSTLKARGYEANVTPSIVLVAAFCEVLRAWSAEDRFTINFPIFDRQPVHPQINRVVGDFTSTLLVSVEKTDGTFAQRMDSIQQQVWRDLEHRHFSGVRVIRELRRIYGGTARATMPIVVTSLLDQPLQPTTALGREIFATSQTPQVLLDFQIREIGGELLFNWDTIEGVVPGEIFDDMFQAFCGLLANLSDAAELWHRAHFPLVPQRQLQRRAGRHQAAFVVDRQHRPRPDWVVGEIAIAPLADASPLASAWSAASPANGAADASPGPETLLPTGRLGRYRPDGTIEDLGAADLRPAAGDPAYAIAGKWEAAATSRMPRAPHPALERVVTGLCREMFGASEIGRNDNLFHIGADSLKVTRLCGRLREIFAVELPMDEIFDQPTVSCICEIVTAERTEDAIAIAEALEQLTAADVEQLLGGEFAAQPRQ